MNFYKHHTSFKMKVLIMGSPTSKGYRAFGFQQETTGGGWVENLVENLSKNTAISVSVCFYSNFCSAVDMRIYKGVAYFCLPIKVRGLTSCNASMIEDLKKVLKEVQPNVVHIIGTEREHNLKMLELAGADKTVISITGMVSKCANHYLAGINEKKICRLSLGDILRRGGPIKEKKLFDMYGKYEYSTIGKAKYVMGRTTWDYACVKQINPNIHYIHCGEILNPIFQQYSWNINKIHRYRIFVSQASYPLKGLHMLIEAFPTILKFFPDSEIVIAGINILDRTTLRERIKLTTYAKYLLARIKELEIPEEKIIWTGPLNPQEMADQYLNTHVYVLPSAIENSPNSLGEAMLLGVPCVAAGVGGVQDMLRDRVDGFIYPFDEPYMLAHYICNIFKNDDLAIRTGTLAKEKLKKCYDVKNVINTTLEVYNMIFKNKGNSNEQ